MGINLLIRQVGVFVLVLAAWAVGDALSWFNPDVIPPINDVAQAFVTTLARPEFWPAIWFTLRDALLSVAIATLFGVPLGLLIGMFPRVEISTRILLDFCRTFPVIALVPIFILIIGTNHVTKVTMITIACFFPIIVQTIYGARRLDPTVVDTVLSFRIPPAMRFRKVILPSASPYIATGIRLSLSIAILVAVAAEILTQVPGLGTQVSLARTFNEVAVAFVYTLCAGLLGVALTATWDLAEKRLLGWHHREEQL